MKMIFTLGWILLSCFESPTGKINDYPELKEMLALLLFQGQSIMYNPDNMAIDAVLMFGFVKVKSECVIIANRIFETRLYNMFLTLSEIDYQWDRKLLYKSPDPKSGAYRCGDGLSWRAVCS